MESEQYRKYYSSKVSHSTNRTTKHAVGVRVHVWHQSKVRAIAGFEEESHAGDQTEHRGFVLWIEEADGDEEGAGDDTDEKNPAFLQPEVGGDVFVEEIADDAS